MMIKRYGERAGIQVDRPGRRAIGVHSLRKTAITDAIHHGADLRDVQQWAGHSSITTTQLYTINTGKEASRAARHVQIR